MSTNHFWLLQPPQASSLRCFAITKDGGWEHPGHCCNAIKSGLHNELGMITRKEAKLIENVVQTTLLYGITIWHYNFHYDFWLFCSMYLEKFRYKFPKRSIISRCSCVPLGPTSEIPVHN